MKKYLILLIIVGGVSLFSDSSSMGNPFLSGVYRHDYLVDGKTELLDLVFYSNGTVEERDYSGQFMGFTSRTGTYKFFGETNEIELSFSNSTMVGEIKENGRMLFLPQGLFHYISVRNIE